MDIENECIKNNVIQIYVCHCFPIDFKSQTHIQQINTSL